MSKRSFAQIGPDSDNATLSDLPLSDSEDYNAHLRHRNVRRRVSNEQHFGAEDNDNSRRGGGNRGGRRRRRQSVRQFVDFFGSTEAEDESDGAAFSGIPVFGGVDGITANEQAVPEYEPVPLGPLNELQEIFGKQIQPKKPHQCFMCKWENPMYHRTYNCEDKKREAFKKKVYITDVNLDKVQILYDGYQYFMDHIVKPANSPSVNANITSAVNAIGALNSGGRHTISSYLRRQTTQQNNDQANANRPAVTTTTYERYPDISIEDFFVHFIIHRSSMRYKLMRVGDVVYDSILKLSLNELGKKAKDVTGPSANNADDGVLQNNTAQKNLQGLANTYVTIYKALLLKAGDADINNGTKATSRNKNP